MSGYQHSCDIDLCQQNTMALSCVVSDCVNFYTEQQIVDFLADYKQSNNGLDATKSLFVLSGGSNVLLPPKLNAYVLRPLLTGHKLVKEDEQHAYVEVMAGENWHEWVLKSIQNGWYGLENMALIPGLVGASPVQNIGAYGVELCDFFDSLTAINLQTAKSKVFKKSDCQFAYRDSIFKQNPNTWLITKVVFKLNKTPNVNLNYADIAVLANEIATKNNESVPTPNSVAKAIVQTRQKKLPDPKQLPNTGSFFKNPVISMQDFKKIQEDHGDLPHYPQSNDKVKLAAGWLIDQAGLKGFKQGDIATHINQALVVVNHAPNISTQKDIKRFSSHIQQSVLAKFNVVLEREPVWVNEDASTN